MLLYSNDEEDYGNESEDRGAMPPVEGSTGFTKRRRADTTVSGATNRAAKSVGAAGRGGRVAKGKDFWSIVDSWFWSKTSMWGDKLDHASWKL